MSGDPHITACILTGKVPEGIPDGTQGSCHRQVGFVYHQDGKITCLSAIPGSCPDRESTEGVNCVEITGSQCDISQIGSHGPCRFKGGGYKVVAQKVLVRLPTGLHIRVLPRVICSEGMYPYCVSRLEGQKKCQVFTRDRISV